MDRLILRIHPHNPIEPLVQTVTGTICFERVITATDWVQSAREMFGADVLLHYRSHSQMRLTTPVSSHCNMDGQSMNTSSPTSPISLRLAHVDFPGGELQRALEEQSFGISRFDILYISPHEAKARIMLLGEDEVTILLTTSGYSVVEGDQCPSVPFESLEDLLASLSPRYVEERRQILLDKLQALAERANQPEEA